MPLIPLLIGSSTALGVGYFCADVYRNRRKLVEKPVPETDLTCYESGIIPEGDSFQGVGQAITHAGHGIAEASSERTSGGIGHCVEAIAHSLSNH
ncbi:hypothetical protein [Egbenema bharatensis]|uniref:hypothetical protein n=1 Tax=Egbenema bharatensis TaxID=3463334 RepID=UPI003A87A836